MSEPAFRAELARYDRVVTRHRDDSSPEAQAQVAWALASKGWLLSEHERNEEALAFFDEVIESFGKAAEIGIREQVAFSLLWKGVVLSLLQRVPEAAAAYGALVGDFSEGESAAIDGYLTHARARLRRTRNRGPWSQAQTPYA